MYQRQAIPIVRDIEQTEVTDVSKLIGLFDAADCVECDVTLFEHESPGAEYAARLWASTRNYRIEISTQLGDDDKIPFQVVYVLKGARTLIRIHRKDVRP
jgi:hypothetical protein